MANSSSQLWLTKGPILLSVLVGALLIIFGALVLIYTIIPTAVGELIPAAAKAAAKAVLNRGGGGEANNPGEETPPPEGGGEDPGETPIPPGDAFKIYLHWSAGGYTSIAPAYTYSIDGNGKVHQMNGGEHTFGRNSNSVGISVMAMAGGTTGCFRDKRGSACPTPVTPAQHDAMVTLAARIAKEKGIPVDKDHIMTHGEAGSLMDYPEAMVNKFMAECGNTDACAAEAGLPHNNYGPYRGGTSERWEFYRFENSLRGDIRTKLTKLQTEPE